MIAYLGSLKKSERLTIESVVQNFNNDLNSLGFWCTSGLQSAKPFAMGTETVIQKSETDFWEDGEPKIVQLTRTVDGVVYKVYMVEPHLKKYEDYDIFMADRDRFCDYFGTGKKRVTWKDKAVLLNKEEANVEFRSQLSSQGFDGFWIPNVKLPGGIADLYCLFSEDSIHIADVIPSGEIG